MPTGFSLLGGPLHTLGRRLGLVRGGANTVLLGVVLGIGPWLVLLLLALLAGDASRLFSLSVIAAHVRLLAVIPLFFLCETWVDPRMSAFVGVITRSGVVPEAAQPALAAEVARVRAWKDSWIPDVACLLLTLAWSLGGARFDIIGTTSDFDPARAASGIPLAGAWYWFFCLPLFRFLALRWLWRLGEWTWFLSRVARLDLELVPTHPDGAGGLGYLEVVHLHLLPLILALSAVQSAALAEEIGSGAMPFSAVYGAFGLVLAVVAVLFLGPMFLFTPRLWSAQVQGMADYMEFAADYVSRFDRKWLGGKTAPAEPLLGTSDLQSLADLGNSVSVIRRMRWVPISFDLLRDYGVAAILPMLPLGLMKYPLAELAEKFFVRLTGLQP